MLCRGWELLEVASPGRFLQVFSSKALGSSRQKVNVAAEGGIRLPGFHLPGAVSYRRRKGGQREGKGRHTKYLSQRAEESLLVSNRWENKNNKKHCRKSIKATPGGRHG